MFNSRLIKRRSWKFKISIKVIELGSFESVADADLFIVLRGLS
jgi:hypothetical protein